MSSLTPCFPFGHLPDDKAGPNRFPPIAIAESFQMHLLTVAHISPIVSLIAGVLILVMPRFLNFIVAGVLDSQRPAGSRIAEVVAPLIPKYWIG